MQRKIVTLVAMAVLVFAVVVGYLAWQDRQGQKSKIVGGLAYKELPKSEEEREEEEGSGKGDRYRLYPSGTFYEQRAYPYGDVPMDQYAKALDLSHAAQRSLRAANLVPTWNDAGPTNVPGRISAIAVDPTDPNTFYAGSAAGGVFKTTDHGASWTPIFDAVGTYSIGAIATHPTNPNIIYVGTGEATGATDDYEGNGVYKSIDGGANWTHIGLDSVALIGKITIDPLRPETLYVAGMGKVFGRNTGANFTLNRGLYRSLDGGATWSKRLFVDNATGCIDVALFGDEVYAAMWNFDGITTDALYRSTNNGASFSLLSGSGSLPAPGSGIDRIGVSIDPVTGTYWVLHVDEDGTFHSVYRSRDGVNWTRVNDFFLDYSFSDFGWYFGQIRAVLGDSTTAYVLGVTLWKTSDKGNSWYDVTGSTHVDHHDLVVRPKTGGYDLYGGCDGGVNFSSDQAGSWTTYKNMHNTQFYAMTIDPNNPLHVLGGTQDNGTNRTVDGGTGNWEHIIGGDGFYVVVDYSNSNVIYGESQNGNIVKSTDGGVSFFGATSGINGSETRAWNTPIVMDPVHPSILYTSTDRIYRTIDGAGLWTVISPDMTAGYVTVIGVSAADSQVIYAGTTRGEIWRTLNNGGTWTRVDGIIPDRWVTRLTPSPTNALLCYATVSGYIRDGVSLPHVFTTSDGGTSWTDITSNLPQTPVNDIIIDPSDPNTLYVATDVGVYVSNNLGGTWTLYGSGMPITCVVDLNMHRGSRKLVAATHGRSMYWTLAPCPGTTDTDLDGVPDLCDNCPGTINPTQADIDNDGLGDACDDCVDPDRDGLGNSGYPMTTCSIDNCPTVYNPGQEDLNGNLVGDACEYLSTTTFDTISTSCLNLVVNNFGSGARSGTQGLTLDYLNQGDCAGVYLYDGSPIIIDTTSGVLDAHYAFAGNHGLFTAVFGNPVEPTADSGDYYVYKTGTYVTNNLDIAVEKSWYAPKAADSCQFMIQRIKYYSWDGNTHTGVVLGEALDWDVPSAFGSDNTAGTVPTSKLIYQVGVGAGCQSNTSRFAGIALLGTSTFSGGCAIDTGASPYSARTGNNATYIYGGVVPSQINALMQQAGYGVSPTTTDQFSVMTFFNSATISPSDTLYVYTVLSTIRNGTVGDLVGNVNKAKKWLAGHFGPACVPSCCTGLAGNIDCDPTDNVDISDLTALIDNLYVSLAPLCCPKEADCDGETGIDIADLTALIDFLYISFTPIAPCH